MPLPYPGYTWSLTQHANKINTRDVYALAAAAQTCRTRPNPNTAANRLLTELSREGAITLTSSIRSAIASPWRDYQQILAELGLMFSTEVVRTPQLTQMGMMFLDSNIGFDEMLTTQALRYQYPNGLKTDIQTRMAEALRHSGARIPDSRLELDAAAGVLIRPAVLIARVLIELQKGAGRRRALTVDQVASCLMPLRTKRSGRGLW